MTLPLVTCSKRILQLVGPLALVAASTIAATVSGTIEIDGSSGSARHNKADYSGVVVWLTSPATSSAHISAKRAMILQRGKKFDPHILPIEAGTSVDFPNLDPIFHNAFSNFDGQIFDIGLYPPGQTKTVKFGRTGVVRVFCNIHPSMSAIILVLNSPYFAVSDRRGHYKLDDVPAGNYTIHFFDERATPETLNALTQPIAIVNDTCAPPIRISRAAYLPVAHKNKYGQDYPPSGENAAGYKAPVK